MTASHDPLLNWDAWMLVEKNCIQIKAVWLISYAPVMDENKIHMMGIHVVCWPPFFFSSPRLFYDKMTNVCNMWTFHTSLLCPGKMHTGGTFGNMLLLCLGDIFHWCSCLKKVGIFWRILTSSMALLTNGVAVKIISMHLAIWRKWQRKGHYAFYCNEKMSGP